MRQKWILTSTLCAIAVALVVFTLQAAPGLGSCQQIKSACVNAGFVPGGAFAGNGLWRDCIRRIMQGRAPGDGLPLPWISPRLVAACRASDPDFGQPRWALGARNAQRFGRSSARASNGQAQPPYAGPTPQGAPATAETALNTPPSAAAAQNASPSTLAAPQAPPPGTTAQDVPATAGENAPGQPRANGSKRPNIVFILTDDLSTDLVQYMPHVLKMQKEGVAFANYFVTDSLCCPSRASIFTGRYPHDTGVFTNKGPDGGFMTFRSRGNEKATFATTLSAAGYRTAMLGKYLNGYQPANPRAPGWSSWAVAGNAYREFNYSLNQDGEIATYGGAPADYLTDVISDRAVRFIKASAGAPFMVELATFAPHRPSTPAPRDANALPGLRAPRPAAFNAAPDTNAVSWLRRLPALSRPEMEAIDAEYRRRAQSVLAIDKMIGDLQAAVAAIGEADNTYFVFSSDNGYHMGEHRLLPGKQTAYDTDIRVPLIVTGPGVPAGVTSDEIAQNIDLCPTFAELGGAVLGSSVDGRSLVPLLRGQKLDDWRTVALVEHHGRMKWDPGDPDAMDLVDQSPYDAPNAWPSQRGLRHGNAPSYEAIRARTWVYVEYVTGEKEYHDLAADPDELRNSFSSLSSTQQASLHSLLAAIQNCHDEMSCRAAEQPISTANQR